MEVARLVSGLPLIIIGVMKSGDKLSAILREKRCYLVALQRNLVIPLLNMPTLLLVPLDGSARLERKGQAGFLFC